MSYWLLKTEPGEWSWDSQSESGGISKWDGVRSPQAQRHMRDMCIGDLCFFYHTGKEKAIVGIVAVTVAAYPDPSDPDGKCDMVDVCEVCKLNETVTLKALKDDHVIDDFLLLRQPRLSVVPVSQHNWERACKLGGLTAALIAPWKPLKKRAQRSKKATVVAGVAAWSMQRQQRSRRGAEVATALAAAAAVGTTSRTLLFVTSITMFVHSFGLAFPSHQSIWPRFFYHHDHVNSVPNNLATTQGEVNSSLPGTTYLLSFKEAVDVLE